MARKFGRKNEVKVDISNYSYAFLGESGFGKSTFAYELGKHVSSSDEGSFLIEVGMEDGVRSIPNAFYENAPSWEVFTDIVDELCENRSAYQDTKFIVIDVYDELIRIAEEEAIRKYNSTVEASKRVNSINAAWSGFGKGQDFVVDLILSQLQKLREHGYQFIILGHLKSRNITDPVTGIEFTQMSATCSNKYWNAVLTKVQVGFIGYIDREFVEIKAKKMKIAGKEISKNVGELVSATRMMAFRDSDNIFNTKSRFPEIAEKCDFSLENFVSTIEDAIKAQVKKQFGTVDEQELKQIAAKQHEELNKDVEIAQEKYSVVDRDTQIEYIQANQAKISDENKQQILAILKQNSTTITNAPDNVLTEIYNIVKSA